MKTRSYRSGSALALLILAVSAQADVVTDWNTVTLDAIRAHNTPPPEASRALAIVHASIYDAVNGISRICQCYFVQSACPASASKVAATTTAAHDALVALFPGSAQGFDRLNGSILAGVADGPNKRAGIAWGQSVAAQMLAWRDGDGWDATVDPPADTGPGCWVPTPPAHAPYLLPQWGFVTPLTIMDPQQFRPPGPPALKTAQWAAEYNEVKQLGVKFGSSRTEDQSEIALFWADGAGTETPPGHWNSIAQEVANAQGNSLEENARLFALLNLAMADAAICAWDAKYVFHFWRPITAIRDGDSDGNPATSPASTWTPFIATPPFPEYVSGHSTFSAAAASVLAWFYGTDAIAFTAHSDALPGIVRSFPSVSAAAAEAAVSRLYGGIHFRTGIEDGLTVGVGIGEWACTQCMQVKGNRSRK